MDATPVPNEAAAAAAAPAQDAEGKVEEAKLNDTQGMPRRRPRLVELGVSLELRVMQRLSLVTTN